MFIRERRKGGNTYLCLVESVRERGKQRIICNLGCKEEVEASSDLDRLGWRRPTTNWGEYFTKDFDQ
jgi:hypothetical protein